MARILLIKGIHITSIGVRGISQKIDFKLYFEYLPLINNNFIIFFYGGLIGMLNPYFPFLSSDSDKPKLD